MLLSPPIPTPLLVHTCTYDTKPQPPEPPPPLPVPPLPDMLVRCPAPPPLPDMLVRIPRLAPLPGILMRIPDCDVRIALMMPTAPPATDAVAAAAAACRGDRVAFPAAERRWRGEVPVSDKGSSPLPPLPPPLRTRGDGERSEIGRPPSPPMWLEGGCGGWRGADEVVEVSPGQLERLLRAGAAVADGWEAAWRRGLLGLRRMPRLEAM